MDGQEELKAASFEADKGRVKIRRILVNMLIYFVSYAQDEKLFEENIPNIESDLKALDSEIEPLIELMNKSVCRMFQDWINVNPILILKHIVIAV